MIRSLRFRLAIGAVIAIVISLIMVWWALSRLFTDYVVSRYVAEMSVLSDSLAAGVMIRKDHVELTNPPSDPRLNLPAGGRYWQLDAKGQEPLRSRSMWDTVLSADQISASGYQPFGRAEGPDGNPVLVYAQTSMLNLAGVTHQFVIRTAYPEAELRAALAGFHGELRRMLILTALVLSAAALAQAILGLRPLDRLRGVVAQVRAGALSRLDDKGPQEIRPLVREINLLLSERDAAVQRARQRASDLAHGFKTPLTVLAQLSSRLDPASAEIALRQVELIRQRADRQLQAARLGVERMATANIATLAGRLAQVLRPLTDERDIAWSLIIAPDLTVPMDPADLAEAIGNVLDNATKWTRSRIEMRGHRDGDHVVLTVADDGPGIPASERDAMLRRGIHASTDGSGLGLAISSDIVEAYGGRLTLAGAAIGGLEVQMRLPLRSATRPVAHPV